MKVMASDTVQQIKDRLTIQDVVSPYVKLNKAGRSLVGLCPFHKEKTGSFHVSLERGSWHCFGCGEGGDMFSFIEKIEGVDFKGALKILAEKAGVPIEYSASSRERSSRTERLREAMQRAADWYAANLNVGRDMFHMGASALAYAKKRGLTEETIIAWRLGFAPEAWRTLLEALTAEGFSIPELLAAGLVKEAEGKPGTYYDRFRNRLMFPIRDTAGRVVAFTGRAMPSKAPAREGAAEPAKYLNSPETELFHKSEILFGMDRAKEAIRTRRFTMLVEGQMDVLLAHQAGFGNTIALSGTALTERHLGLMKRYSENLMLVLDADAAGLKATARSALLALEQGMKVKAAKLPAGKDPADLILEDPKAFTESVARAKPIVDFFLTALTESERDPHRLVAAAEGTVLPLIAAMPSPMEREHFAQAAARALGLSAESVRESLARLRKPGGPKQAPAASSSKGVRGVPGRSARQQRGERLLAVVHAYQGSSLAERVKSEYSRIIGAGLPPTDSLPEGLVFGVERDFGESPGEGAADELLHAFEEAVIREAHQTAVAQLRAAESSGDTAAIEAAQAICAEIAARLAAF